MTDQSVSPAPEDVRSVRTPIGIFYDWTAGPGASAFLQGLLDGRLVGNRCPVCTKVYLPPRGPCPTCAVLLGEPVELGDGGTVTTFCVVNVPFLGQSIEIPYVAASILVDGADIAFSHLILGCDASEVRMGMRVEAVWRPRDDGGWGPTLENIDHFRPSGEPDAPFESYGRHL
jgi:uncharacterized OB-fold protein